MRYKLSAIGFPYLAGVFCASLFTQSDVLTFLPFLLGFAGIVIAATVFILKNKSAGLVIFSFFTAFLVMLFYSMLQVNPLRSFEGETVEINGVIVGIGNVANDAGSFTVRCKLGEIETDIPFYATDNPADYGDTVKFKAKLSALVDSAGFPQKSYYNSKNIYLKATPTSEISIVAIGEKPLLRYVGEYNEYIQQQIRLAEPNSAGYLLNAFLGDKSRLDFQQENAIKRTGLSHLTAVSGMHLTITVHLLMQVLGLLRMRRKKRVRMILLLTTILLFVIFFDFSASVIRCSIMLIIFYGAEPFHRKNSTINSIGGALFIILLFEPYAFCDVGLLLSIAGTIAVGVVAPAATARIKIKRKSLQKIFILLSGSFFAGICMLPLLYLFFGGVSIAAPLAFLAVYPLFAVALFLLLIFTLTGGTLGFLVEIAGVAAKIINAIIDFISSFKYAYLPLDYDFLPAFLLISGIFIGAVYLFTQRKNFALRAMFTALTMLVVLIAADQYVNRSNTKINVFSDGDDAAVYIKASDYAVVITSNASPKIYNETLVFMQNNFLDELDILCVMNSNNNYMRPFSTLACRELITPEDAASISTIDEVLQLYCDNEAAIVTLKNSVAAPLTISISAAKSPLFADIGVVYGYSKKLAADNIFNADYQYLSVLAHKRYIVFGGNSISAYYNNIEFILTNEGRLINAT